MKNYIPFSELTDSQKQNMTQEFLRDISIINQNTVVEYILSKSYECGDAPFSYDDITNNEPSGSIMINGDYLTLTENERDEKLEFYERLRDKADSVVDARYKLLSNSDNAEYDTLETKHDKSENLHSKFESICDDLECMDFEDFPEVFQWFECDSFLLDRLEEHGECILDGTYWGRQTCGQSIVLDHVMQKIAYDDYINTPTNCLPNRVDFLLSPKEVA